MSDNTENIPVQNERDTNVLGFSEEELLDELGLVFATNGQLRQPQRQPGDFDYYQLIDKFGVCRESVRLKMMKLCRTGTWRRLWVYDKDNARVMVFRKV